ncbi:hypothetical protein MKX03_014446 [Papaver bracteatum]|nr:hypothetical protein MKX03_014446 [Papaver bracteatum]
MINIVALIVVVLVLVIMSGMIRRRCYVFKTSLPSSYSAKSRKVSLEEKDLLVDELPAGLIRERIPNHVAVIMDGNRRWAKQKGLTTRDGHDAGLGRVLELIPLCCKYGVKVLTVFAFSTENWNRSQEEVAIIMLLFGKLFTENLETFMREGVRVSVIGDWEKLPRSLQRCITNVTRSTKNNRRFHLIMAINYGGRHDIIQACRNISHKVKDGVIKPKDINEALINQELRTNCTEFPYPDLLIRTSGEQRISNFLMWQLAYTELYFESSFWPDFGNKEFVKALLSFQGRNRRFGGEASP